MILRVIDLNIDLNIKIDEKIFKMCELDWSIDYSAMEDDEVFKQEQVKFLKIKYFKFIFGICKPSITDIFFNS